MQIKSVAAWTELTRVGTVAGPEAMDRERLYDLIVRFRLRPVRQDAGRAAARPAPARMAKWGLDPLAAGGVTDSGIERFERGVIIIDALGRVLFVNRTADSQLEGPGPLERSAAGFLRLPTRELQLRFVEYLIHRRRVDRFNPEHGDENEALELRVSHAERGDSCQITVAPLLDRPLARLVERSGPLHAVFVYESPSAIGWL